MITVKGLPEEIEMKENTLLSLEYTMDQTFHTYEDPELFTYERSRIYFDLNFKEGNIETDALYRITYRQISCNYDRNSYDANLKYTFSEESRQINDVDYSYRDWDFLHKHPSFYSGTNMGDEEYFILDEMMILHNDIVEGQFSKNITEFIELEGNVYSAIKFTINTSFDTEILFSG